MKLLKNKEVRLSLFLQGICSATACAICFCLDVCAGFVTIILGVLLMSLFYITTCHRYRKIAELSDAIDHLLHGDNTVLLTNCSEGELAVLHSEIYKMTVRLREQQQRLINDKVYLADSIADISHQIRTPLTSINLLLQFLSEPNLSDERRYQLTRELYDLLSRIDWLITTLLKISKLDAGTVQFKSEKIDWETLIQKACSPLLVPIELKNQKLVVDAFGDFFGDISWVCEAIGNIVKNCMEHTPSGGTLEIVADETVLYSEIVIKDTGSGIAKEDMPHIFERFYKGKNSDDKSFGIGLSLARMIISRQNGTIKAENRKPSGTVFTIRFYKGTV